MTTVALGEVAAINPRGERVAATDVVSFVGMAELNAETAVAQPLGDREFAEVSKGYTVFRDGDVLAAKITPCWENGKVGQARLDHPIGVGSTEFHVLRPTSLLDDRYLLHFLRQPSVRAAGELRMTGSGGQRRVPVAFLQELPIPLPPLPEQRRIAAILDHADALRAKRRQLLAHLDSLSQSIFYDMFSEGGFGFVALKEAIKWRSGKFLPAKEQNPGPYPVYGGNGVNGSHDAYMFEEPRLVVGRVGAYCGAVHVTRPFSWVTDNALIATLLRDDLTLDYLLPALSVANLNQYAGVSGQPSISAGKIGDVLLPVPPVDLQRTFADRIARVRIQADLTRTASFVESDLFASLQSRAFGGEL